MGVAIFAGGCFWGVEASFYDVKGVTKTAVGYIGGQTPNPNYEQVCTGKTGHAEAVFVEFDPNIITFEKLLEIFFSVHNPTTLNAQGPDIGTQYRSAIFCTNKAQEVLANRYIVQLENKNKFKDKIVTQVIPATRFYEAEEYHQKYFRKNPNPHCQI